MSSSLRLSEHLSLSLETLKTLPGFRSKEPTASISCLELPRISSFAFSEQSSASPLAIPSRPSTDDELLAWLQQITGHRIPARSVCPDHDAPAAFVCDFFFHRATEALVLANRAGGKTEDTSDLHLANGYWKRGHETSHIGAIDIQAKRCYAYYLHGLRHPLLAGQAPDPHIRDTEWTNGSRIEILPGTDAQTQGGHPFLVTFDELEQGKRQPYENAKSMPVEWQDGGEKRLGQFLATSTRQTSLGLMQRALDEAEANDIRVYTWCVIETIDGATCRDADGAPLCEGCPIFNAGCEGRALNADGWRSRDDVLATYRRVGADTWEAQHLCRKPDAKALIYAPFSAANISEAAEYVPGAGPVYAWYDWGFTDATYIGLLQYRDGALYQFDELVGSGRSEREWVREAIRRIIDLPEYDGPTYEEWERVWATGEGWPDPWPNSWIEVAAGDPSAVQMRHEWKEHGVGARTAAQVTHNVETGQDVLRAIIHAGGDVRRLIIHPRNVRTITCLQRYRARELDDGSFDPRPDPDPANHVFSHGCDMLRYGAWTMRKAFGIITEGGTE